LIYFIPGRGDTLRIDGRARIVKEAPFFDDMIVKGNRPQLALLVEIEEIFHHCSKAFLRSQLWKPETWEPDAMPSRARISKALKRQDPGAGRARAVLRQELRGEDLPGRVLTATAQGAGRDTPWRR